MPQVMGSNRTEGKKCLKIVTKVELTGDSSYRTPDAQSMTVLVYHITSKILLNANLLNFYIYIEYFYYFATKD